MQKVIATISTLFLGIRSFRIRGRDHLDFQTAHVGKLGQALTAAYLAGYAAGIRASNGSVQDTLPTEVHQMKDGEWVAAGPLDANSLPNAEEVITAPIPEVELIKVNADMDNFACTVLIPNAVKHRRIG